MGKPVQIGISSPFIDEREKTAGMIERETKNGV